MLEYIKHLFNPPLSAGVGKFSDYIADGILEVYHQVDNKEPIRIGDVPKIVRTEKTTTDVTVTITYPFVPLIKELTPSNRIQFNGADILLTTHKTYRENLFIPMTVHILLDGKPASKTITRIPVEYGTHIVTHEIPCARIAKQVVKQFMRKHRVFGTFLGDKLSITNWDYLDGELFIYTTLTPVVDTIVRVGRQLHQATYAPTAVRAENGYRLEIHQSDIDRLVETFAPSNKYRATCDVIYDEGIAEVIIERTVIMDDIDDNLIDFKSYLNHLGFNVSDENLYDYSQMRKVGGYNG